MITPEQAWRLIVRHTKKLPVQKLALHQCLHHVLAQNVLADRDIPPADRAAMDGYAVRATDLAKEPVTLTVVGEVAAGSPAAPSVSAAQAVRIFTGANVPPGADAVVMREDTEPERVAIGARVRILRPVPRGANIFRQGENAGKGRVLLRTGDRIQPAHCGVCAAVGASALKVIRQPTVSLLCTGAELLDASASAAPHQLRNSNGPMLAAALTAYNYTVTVVASAPDNAARIARAMRHCLAHSDVLLTTGGVSVGDYDLVPDAVQRLGAVVRFHKVAIKPGKPLLFATCSDDRCIFALPGNPLSAMNCFFEFVLPTLGRLGGTPPGHCRPVVWARLASGAVEGDRRQKHVLGRILWRDSGPFVEIVRSVGTADLVAGGQADGTIMVPAGADRTKAGAVVAFRPWRQLP
mgnify:CR=1 FL=1